MKKLGTTLTGVIIFSGLPLLGWGLRDINGFFENNYRTTYLIAITILTVLVGLVVPESGRSRGQGQKLVQKQKIALAFLQLVPPLIFILAPYFDKREAYTFQDKEILRAIGICLTIIGYLLMNWATIMLDKQFSVDVTIQENHKLVTNGPYKYIRHPRYLGITIFFLGVSFTFLSWFSLYIVLITLIVLFWRIKDEESLLHKEFGEEWGKYKEKTNTFLPFIY